MKGRVKIVLVAIILVLSVVFLYHSVLSARKNQFSGILPPSRLNSAVDVNAALMAEEPIEPIYPDLQLIINIPARKVTLYDNGQEIKQYDIAVGQPIYKTPVGPRSIERLVWNPSWIPPDSPWAAGEPIAPPGPNNPLGPVKMKMGDGIMLHGTNKDSSVGRYASHGCMRMHNEEASSLAWYIQKRLNESDDALLEKYKKFRRTSFWVNLNYPVSVNITYEPVEVRDNVIMIYYDVYGWGRNIKTETLDALMKNGIDLKKIDAERISCLEYPKEKYGVKEVRIEDLLYSTNNGQDRHLCERSPDLDNIQRHPVSAILQSP